MSKFDSRQPSLTRRGFLEGVVVTGMAATGAALATGSAAAAGIDRPDSVPPTSPADTGGYRETEHVKAYYRSAAL